MSGDRRVDHDSQVDGKQVVVSMERPHRPAVCPEVPLVRTPVWAVRTPTSLLHGTGVRGWVGVNAFTQLNLSIKSNLPPPSDRALSSGHHEVCLARAKAGKEARQPHSEARVVPGSRCPDLIFHCSCSLKVCQTRSAGPGQGDSMSLATDASACSPSSASGLHATCGWGIQ